MTRSRLPQIAPQPGALPHLRINPRTRLHEARDGRSVLHQSSLGRVEDVAVEAAKQVPPGFTGRTRIAITYLGAAYWKIGRREDFVDSNRTLLLRAGDAFVDREMGQQIGRASVVLTPAAHVLEEIEGQSPGDKAMTRPASPRVQSIAHALLTTGNAAHRNPLQADELMIAALSDTLESESTRDIATEPRLVGKVKEILHSENAPGLSLGDVAAMVGYSAVHVRKVFGRSEGMPLHRYQLQLRLGRALIELRACDDITTLALDLGFSSHSHFAFAFRSMFQVTPSQYRASMRDGAPLPSGW